MKYELYIDEFFTLNFFMDTLLLFLIRKVFKCTATHLRLMAGGAFGAAMACAVTVASVLPAWLRLFAGYGIVSICMLKISFPSMTLRTVCRAAVYLYGFAFLLGGVLELLAVQVPLFRRCGIGIIGICMAGAVTYLSVGYLYGKYRKRRSCYMLPVKLIWQGRELSLRALVDTGNSLYEPVSRRPVSIVEKEAMDAAFPDKRLESFRAIPYHSVGRSHGILEGYEITELIIFGEDEKIKIEKPVVGLFDGRLSAKAAYQMILHPTLTKWQEEEL